jgi:exo-beta-1,3-glucanase (GH17 family)
MCLLADQVKADMRQISAMTNRVKTYSLACSAANTAILDYAKDNSMEIALGVWVSKDNDKNKKEISTFRKLYAKYAGSGVIADIVIGNEPIFIQRATVKQLVDYIKEIRAVVDDHGGKARLGSAELQNIWEGKSVVSDTLGTFKAVDMKPVVVLLDWIGINSHPYYSGIDGSSGDAGQFVRDAQVCPADCAELLWSAIFRFTVYL